MIKKINYLILLFTFILIIGCSFDNQTGIWSGEELEQKRISELEQQTEKAINVVKIYSQDALYSKEISAVKNVILAPDKKNSSWLMPGLNLQNSTGNIYLSGVSNKFLKKKIGKNKFTISKIMSSPIIFENNIIFSDDTGSIFSINNRGKKNWKLNIYKKIYKKIYKNLTLSIYNNNVYVADNVGFIYAINIENGKLLWIKNHGIPLKSKIKVFENKIYLINQDNRLICLDIKQGDIIWDIRSISSFIKTQHFLALAISKQGDLLTLNSAGDLLKAQASNGNILWAFNTTVATLIEDTDFFKSSDIVIYENDIIFSTTTSVFSYNLDNGIVNWKEEIGSKNTPIISGNNVFIITDNGYFVNLDRKTGKIIWSTNILKILKKKKQKTEINGFVMGSGKIYAVSLNGYLIVCSASTGKVKYFKKIGDSITAAPIISNGSLYVLTENSKIIGFN